MIRYRELTLHSLQRKEVESPRLGRHTSSFITRQANHHPLVRLVFATPRLCVEQAVSLDQRWQVQISFSFGSVQGLRYTGRTRYRSASGAFVKR